MRQPALKSLRLKLRARVKTLRQELGGSAINKLVWQVLSEKWAPSEGDADAEAIEGEERFPHREGQFPESSAHHT